MNLQTEQPTDRGSFPDMNDRFFSSVRRPTPQLGLTYPPPHWVMQTHPEGRKRPRQEADHHTPSSNADFRNIWRCNSTPTAAPTSHQASVVFRRPSNEKLQPHIKCCFGRHSRGGGRCRCRLAFMWRGESEEMAECLSCGTLCSYSPSRSVVAITSLDVHTGEFMATTVTQLSLLFASAVFPKLQRLKREHFYHLHSSFRLFRRCVISRDGRLLVLLRTHTHTHTHTHTLKSHYVSTLYLQHHNTVMYPLNDACKVRGV